MIKKMSNGTDLVVQKAADSAAAGSAFLAGAAWLADLEPLMTVAASAVAIVAGAAAAWYHVERARYMHKKNKDPSASLDDE